MKSLAAAMIALILALPAVASADPHGHYGRGGGDWGGHGEHGGGEHGGGERGYGPHGGGEGGGYGRGGYGMRTPGFMPPRIEAAPRGPSRYGSERHSGRYPGLFPGPGFFGGPAPRLPAYPGRGHSGFASRYGWARGQYLPPSARGAVVADYGRYHLRRPPPGYYWYRNGDDFVLAAVASGLIFEVISGY